MIAIAVSLCLFVLFWVLVKLRFDAIQKQMEGTFKALSFDVMEKNGRQFMHMADLALQPMRDSMKQIDTHQRELEKRREGAYAALSSQIEGLVLSEKELRLETNRLVQALRSPQVRGSWGEVHLRRVVELAGLVNHCDFFEQKVTDTERKMRPDVIVRLPGQRQIVIDAKSPLAFYLEAIDATEEGERKKKLQDHAISLRRHIKDLAAKEYWKQFDPTPEYVILFLPAEAFFSTALQADPTLIELGADQNIIVATPTTLIAILRAVALGWKQESLSKSAKEISKLGEELYDRIGILCEYWNKVGKSLNASVEAYNQSMASFESRVLVTARKMKENGSFTKELPELEAVDKIAKVP